MSRAHLRFSARCFTVSRCNVLEALVVPLRALERSGIQELACLATRID
jgi:hypothetical protein